MRRPSAPAGSPGRRTAADLLGQRRLRAALPRGDHPRRARNARVPDPPPRRRARPLHALGHEGARFAWESARHGFDVTPKYARDQAGRLVAIRTGELEEHIVADVAWAACCYADWSGDDAFLEDAGRDLLVETARYLERLASGWTGTGADTSTA